MRLGLRWYVAAPLAKKVVLHFYALSSKLEQLSDVTSKHAFDATQTLPLDWHDPIEDKALSAFTISHQMAKKHGYYSRWSEKTIHQLRKLDPGKYPKEEELRPKTRWADSFTTYPLILKPLPLPKPKSQGGKQ